MTEMVERVARAICRNSGEEMEVPGLELYVVDHWLAHRDDARAAIEAMREPTAWMDEAPMRSGMIDDLGSFTAAEVWRAMIDAALKVDKSG